MLQEILSIVLNFHWQPGFAEPVIANRLIFAVHLIAALLCGFSTLQYSHSSQNSKRKLKVWLGLTIFMLILSVNKLFNLQELFIDIIRIGLDLNGWYEQRHFLQIGFILGIAIISGLFAYRAVKIFSDVKLSHHRLLAISVFFLLGFLMLQAMSFHDIDQLMNWPFVQLPLKIILEICIISLMIISLINNIRSTEPQRLKLVLYKTPKFFALFLILCLLGFSVYRTPSNTEKIYQPTFPTWDIKPFNDKNFFPIGITSLQSQYAESVKDAGINIVLAVNSVLTAADLQQFKAANLYLIGSLNKIDPSLWDNDIIVGWNNGYKPDIFQRFERWGTMEKIGKAWPHIRRAREEWGKYGPPIPVIDIQKKYQSIKKTDSSRPVWTHLSQVVAFPNNHNYEARGFRQGHREDYAEYMKGCDIVSFDFFSYSFPNEVTQKKIWLLANGVDNLYKWSNGQKVVWGFVETTRAYRNGEIPPPEIIKAQVWMQIIHGATGIVYYADGYDQFGQRIENALLIDSSRLAVLKEINSQIHRLSSIINTPNISNKARIELHQEDVSIDFVVKQSGKWLYIFSVAMRPMNNRATFHLNGLTADTQIEVIGQNRSIHAQAGRFSDNFQPYQVNLYKLKLQD